MEGFDLREIATVNESRTKKWEDSDVWSGRKSDLPSNYEPSEDSNEDWKPDVDGGTRLLDNAASAAYQTGADLTDFQT